MALAIYHWVMIFQRLPRAGLSLTLQAIGYEKTVHGRNFSIFPLGFEDIYANQSMPMLHVELFGFSEINTLWLNL